MPSSAVSDRDNNAAARELRREAIAMLARREYSFVELQQKLRQRPAAGAQPDAMILAVLEALRAEKLQSDDRFVESFVSGRKARGKGPAIIRFELQQRGVATALIEHYLDEFSEEWLALAQRAYDKKFKGQVIEDNRDRAKRLRFMQARGFSADHLRSMPGW